RRHDMRMRERRRMNAGCNETGKMRHVHHQHRADTVADFAEGAEIDDARIGRAAGDDQFRLVLIGELCHFVHVDAMIVAADAVGYGLEPFADILTGEPCVRWPPAARLSPMKVSPGCSRAKNTSAFAEAPECGCTFANLQPNNFVTRS